jgi:hypothetical protein
MMARKNDNSKLKQLVEWFFSTFIGQRILLFLAPFLMPPSPKQPGDNLFVHLHIPYFAPTIGIAFLYSAFLLLIKSLKRHGFDFTWLIQVDNLQTLIKLFLCLLIVIHAAALGRFLAPHLLNLFKKEKIPNVPMLGFWLSYYGGVAMVIGAFAWIIILLAGINLSWLGLLIALCFIVGLVVLARFELNRRHYELYEHLNQRDTIYLTRLELTLFTIFSVIGLSLVFIV